MKTLVSWLTLLLTASSPGLEDPYPLGVQALKDGDTAQARALLERAVLAAPDRTEAWWELGWACWRQQDLDCSVDSWQRVEALQPQHPELQAWLGAARSRQASVPGSAAAAAVPRLPTGATLRLVGAGDTMMGSELRKGEAGLAPGRGEELFTGLQPLFQSADLAFLNLEGPLADGLPSTKCAPGSSACYAFRTPTRYVWALKDLGTDVVSLANNHALDPGPPGQQASMDTLDAAGIAHAGRYGDLAHLQVQGTRVAVVAAATGSCCLNVNRVDEVTRAIAVADQRADLVVLSFHGGAEGSTAQHVPKALERAWGEQRGDVYALAHAAVDAGADLVLGHGPHVLRGIEVYRGRLIAYSLGNFCGYKQFGTRGGPTGTSAVLEVELAANGVLTAARLHAIALDGMGRPRLDPSGAAYPLVHQLSAADFPASAVRVADDGTLSWDEDP